MKQTFSNGDLDELVEDLATDGDEEERAAKLLAEIAEECAAEERAAELEEEHAAELEEERAAERDGLPRELKPLIRALAEVLLAEFEPLEGDGRREAA